MNQYVSIRNQSCPNQVCRFYSKTLEGNVVIHSQKGKRMKCNSCGKTWVAHRNEWIYGLRTTPKKIELAVEMMKRGFSIRKIAEEVGVSPSTVQEWRNRLKNNQIYEKKF